MRAWIEIIPYSLARYESSVALFMRAWIEITQFQRKRKI